MSTVNFKDVAHTIFFNRKINNSEKLVSHYGLQYRSGKNSSDVKKCVDKALKNGHGRTEDELSFLELYLSQTFKKKSTIE